MPLDPKRVQAVFVAAVECDAAADRAAVLDRECSTDPELRRRVEALLRAHDQPDGFLDQPIVGPTDPASATSGEEPPDSSAPTGISTPVDLLSARRCPPLTMSLAEPEPIVPSSPGCHPIRRLLDRPARPGHRRLRDPGRAGPRRHGRGLQGPPDPLNRPCA